MGYSDCYCYCYCIQRHLAGLCLFILLNGVFFFFFGFDLEAIIVMALL